MAISRSITTSDAAFGGVLREARQERGWSQRELSARAGLPQSQISKIETGDVDPQVSTLVELARSLDLELQLVPRGAVGAVEMVVREAKVRKERRGLGQRLDDLTAVVEGVARARADLAEAGDLQKSLIALRRAADELDSETARYGLDDAITKLRDIWANGPDRISSRELKDVRRIVDGLRIAHQRAPARPRPAYSLEDEDDS